MAAVRGFYRSVRLLLGQKHTETRSWNITVRSWSGAAADPAPEINHNEDVNQTFVNRNPRNLEQMAIAVKDRGWSTVWPKREYYHRLVLKRSPASREWALKKQLSSTHSVAACRAWETFWLSDAARPESHDSFNREVPWTFRSDAVQTFWTAMREGGVLLSEPRRKFT
ncbi:hypothetical protein Q7C36_013939 [Tachysurus vachellii]|uniref:Mitochondrial ribosomal protein L18 n=1 Tax=Tachysurus vachellii TaxID=175792 RepID=A0AA88MIS2_TACVA|nr:hypothetical protein Q7C36_013939 [Tachysurus vachellii]